MIKVIDNSGFRIQAEAFFVGAFGPIVGENDLVLVNAREATNLDKNVVEEILCTKERPLIFICQKKIKWPKELADILKEKSVGRVSMAKLPEYMRKQYEKLKLGEA